MLPTEWLAVPGLRASSVDADKVYRPIVVNLESFRSVLNTAVATISGDAVNADDWARASYHPTSTMLKPRVRCMGSIRSKRSLGSTPGLKTSMLRRDALKNSWTKLKPKVESESALLPGFQARERHGRVELATRREKAS